MSESEARVLAFLAEHLSARAPLALALDAKLRSVLLFDIGADTPHRALTDATDAGVGAARARLGGAIEANGTLGSARDGKSGEAPVAKRRVRIELAMRANAAAVMLAEKAFADAFLAHLQTLGHDAEQL